jgi:hypothetical protein
MMTQLEERELIARIDLTLLDIEKRTEEVRQMKAYEWWRLFYAGLTAVALASGVVGAGLGWTLAHLPLSHG